MFKKRFWLKTLLALIVVGLIAGAGAGLFFAPAVMNLEQGRSGDVEMADEHALA